MRGNNNVMITSRAFGSDNDAVIKYVVSASNPTHKTLQGAYVMIVGWATDNCPNKDENTQVAKYILLLMEH